MSCKYEGSGVWEGRCVGTKEVDPCPGYDKCSRFKPDFMTNADHIRSMTDEELAEWLEEVDCYNCDCCVYQRECRLEYDEAKHDCATGRMEWLKQPYVKEEV